MKRSFYLLGLLLVISAFGCKKVKQLTTISQDISYGGVLPTIPPSTIPIPPHGLAVSYRIPEPTYSQQYLTQYHTSSDKVNNVTLKDMAMQILKPVGGKFYFLDSVVISIEAKGQPTQLAAYNYNVPKDQNIIYLTSTNINLKNYFLQDTMYIDVYANFIKAPTDSTSINISTNFNLNANPLN